MGIFGGERYSKKAYKETETDIIRAEKGYASRAADLERLNPGVQIPPETLIEIEKTLLHRVTIAKSRLDEIYGEGQAEAIALNDRYNRLISQAQEAVKALQDFERKKLRMSLIRE